MILPHSEYQINLSPIISGSFNKFDQGWNQQSGTYLISGNGKRKWRKKNREHINAYSKEWYRKRRLNKQ